MEEEIEEEFSGSENEDEPLLSSELITLFAPTNSAFNKLTTERKSTAGYSQTRPTSLQRGQLKGFAADVKSLTCLVFTK